MPVQTKVTGSQVVEKAVTAHALSTRSFMHKSQRPAFFAVISYTTMRQAMVNFSITSPLNLLLS